jgi:hypothetical protein
MLRLWPAPDLYLYNPAWVDRLVDLFRTEEGYGDGSDMAL